MDNGDKFSEELEKLMEGPGEDIGSLVRGGDKDKQGVLHRLITAIATDDDYRQALLTAAFDDKMEAVLCANAISERKRYGVQIDPLVDRIIAQCATKGRRVEETIKGLTHSFVGTNYRGGGKEPSKENKPM